MATGSKSKNGVENRGKTPYERAVLGFKNYWYPACGEKELGRLPERVMLLGEPIALVKRRGKVYAIQDECPHRGARLSMGKDEFPGSNTITCRFHGFTYDLTDGKCVAALTDGPDSPVVGKVRARVYPTEQRKGIVWIWMGKMAPVPLEEDVPKVLLRKDTMVRYQVSKVLGNWRYHAETGADSHLPTLHKDALSMLRVKFYGYRSEYAPYVGYDEDVDDGGPYLFNQALKVHWQADYPGLGIWPPKRWWRTKVQRPRPGGLTKITQGLRIGGIRLPCLQRTQSGDGRVLYGWHTAIDADHYMYFRIYCMFPKNSFHRLWLLFRYYAGLKPMLNSRFLGQDMVMTRDSTEFERRHGANPPFPESLFRADAYPRAWIKMCNELARGEGRSASTESSAAPETATAAAG